ncbi:hypothetical protein [Spiroplasma turonicum]|uniref:Uncharacterized protein n=1 Tax=Spiroplasma turonicum TaxID=216946 RepID=A0A0K1P630_9MOLU|nr:hypothetical protein [Spiroplasma turonicum]AKU79634.1 hypothetical protein STURON_00388 [Spiroplasma turonicum]ALX70655.1 hypothetical protein STURO_v1c03870 [Spiroplasma turonicum]
MIIQIIGQPFSGKTSLAKYIAKKLEIKYFNAENLYYNEYRKVSDSYSDIITNCNDFVVDGSISWFLKSGFYKRDLLIWLELDEYDRFERANNLEMQIDFLKLTKPEHYYKYNNEYFDLSRNEYERIKLFNLLYMEFEIADSKKIIIDSSISVREQFKIVIDLMLEKDKRNYLKGNVDLFKVYDNKIKNIITNINKTLKINKKLNVKHLKQYSRQRIKYEKIISNDKYQVYKIDFKSNFKKNNLKTIKEGSINSKVYKKDFKINKQVSSLYNFDKLIEDSKFIKNMINILKKQSVKIK